VNAALHMDGAVLQLNTAELGVKPLSALALPAPALLALVSLAQLTPPITALAAAHLATCALVESAVRNTDTAERPPTTAVLAARPLSVSVLRGVVPECT